MTEKRHINLCDHLFLSTHYLLHFIFFFNCIIYSMIGCRSKVCQTENTKLSRAISFWKRKIEELIQWHFSGLGFGCFSTTLLSYYLFKHKR